MEKGTGSSSICLRGSWVAVNRILVALAGIIEEEDNMTLNELAGLILTLFALHKFHHLGLPADFETYVDLEIILLNEVYRLLRGGA